MKSNNRWITWLSLATLCALIGFGAWSLNKREATKMEFGSGDSNDLRSQSVVVGGITRPRSDVFDPTERTASAARSAASEARQAEAVKASTEIVGRSPKLPADTNPQVAAVLETLKTGEHPERVSPSVPLPDFDAESYRSDPSAYVAKVEPGRVWQAAQPGEGVPVLKSLTSTYKRIKQGESVRLRVKAQPGAPVTFTSFDLGAFENRLPSITVAANDKGEAEAAFTGIPGTHNMVNILAASPMASGVQRFQVKVSLSSDPLAGR